MRILLLSASAVITTCALVLARPVPANATMLRERGVDRYFQACCGNKETNNFCCFQGAVGCVINATGCRPL